jgi:rhodanese-related sulfurtransferase
MKTLSAQELKAKRRRGDKFTLVNTLSAEAFRHTRLPEAINVPLEGGDFPQRVENNVGGKEEPVVVYCASQECDSSTKAARELESAGFSEVYEFEGGAMEWEASGEKFAPVG